MVPLGHLEIWGLPIALYLGILTFTLMSCTALLGIMVLSGKYNIPFRWHKRVAIAAFASAGVHITLVTWQFFF